MQLSDLSVEEINAILAALAKQPYEQVTSLIDKVKAQGEAQLGALATPSAPEAAIDAPANTTPSPGA